MDDLESTLPTELKQLQRTAGKTNDVFKAQKQSAISRLVRNLREILTDVDKTGREIEALKIAAKVEDGEISQWNDTVDAKTEYAENQMEAPEEWLERKRQEHHNEEQEKTMQFEIKSQKTKLKIQEEHNLKCQHKSTPSEQLVSQAKLPKLVITKFNGPFTDWPRFWGQFPEAIDKSSVLPVTKFTYLPELLDDRVRKTIEALPHSPEGYNRAKAILEERFGKESEIFKAYLKEIIYLLHTPTANPKKILEFFEKLSYNVQALASLNQLNHVNRMVPLTLEKLPTIRGDLV